MILGGIAQFFAGEKFEVRGIIIGIYAIVFGLATGLLGRPSSQTAIGGNFTDQLIQSSKSRLKSQSMPRSCSRS